MREYNVTLECRSEGGRQYISGLAVPWDVEILFGGKPESFAPGSLTQAPVVPFRYAHRGMAEALPVPIGKLADASDTTAGLWVDMRLTDTAEARAVWAAADDDIVTGLSIEFQNRADHPPGGQGRVTDAILTAVALVERPAYQDARVTHVRARRPYMDDLNEWIDDRKRRGLWTPS